MKNIFLLMCFVTLTSSIFAQNMSRDRYTISGGLLAAANLNKFRLDGPNIREYEYDMKAGWSLGAWLNLPLGSAFSLEPQVMYSRYEYQSINGAADLLPAGNLRFISLPILLKIHPLEDLAITLGPQFDFLGSVNNAREYVRKEDFASTSISLSVGIEILPHSMISIFGRYIYGFSDLDNRGDNVPDDVEYYNNNLQLGVKLRLFGDVIPADTDGDGVIDDDDLCPTVAGLAALGGCPDTDGDGITDAIDKCPSMAGIARYDGCPIPDTDNDGVNDEVDKCISVAGFARYDGCPIPDTDGDGVNDENDKCINVVGLEKYAGCPPTDTDKDGVNDDVDQCPTVVGLAQYNGCPPPDRDNDGVTNDKDLCPDVAGPASNFGCPVVESAKFNARMINFRTGSAELTAQSKRDLREGAALMNSSAFNNLVFHIHGHTDHDGSDAFNLNLSKDRASSVRTELIKNGVPPERMTSEGFGEKDPIATNETAAGKALNRRVEILARHNQSLDTPVIVPKN